MIKKTVARTALISAALALFTQGGFSQAQAQTSLFKVVTDRDEIIIGLSAQELEAFGGAEKNAGGIARALVDKKSLTVWRYSVGRSAGGDLQVAPLHQIGLLASQSLRVEPYSSPLPILPHN
jgi:hypothetical protein